jgi:hypothetical protein
VAVRVAVCAGGVPVIAAVGVFAGEGVMHGGCVTAASQAITSAPWHDVGVYVQSFIRLGLEYGFKSHAVALYI